MHIEALENLTPSQHRAAAAFFAFGLGALICIGQQHFTLSLTHPSSIVTASHHRCARCLYAAFAWFFFEAAYLMTRPLYRRRKPIA